MEIKLDGVEFGIYNNFVLEVSKIISGDAKLLVEYGRVVVNSGTITLPSKTINLSGEADMFALSYIQSEIFSLKCVSCHSSNALGVLDLREGKSYAHIYNITAVYNSNYYLVTPYKSDSSYLYMTLVAEHLMPPAPLTELTDDEIEIVKNWIDEGAINI